MVNILSLTSFKCSDVCLRDESNNFLSVNSVTNVGKYCTNFSWYCFMYRFPVFVLWNFVPSELPWNSLCNRPDVVSSKLKKGILYYAVQCYSTFKELRSETRRNLRARHYINKRLTRKVGLVTTSYEDKEMRSH